MKTVAHRAAAVQMDTERQTGIRYRETREDRRMSFFDFWRGTKERGVLLKRASQLKLKPTQLTRLLGDGEVRAALQDDKMVSLLPPVGTEVFRRFTVASLEELKKRQEAKAEQPEHKPANHLENGKPLPSIYGDPPPQFINTPLEDLDPAYHSQKTFMVLSRGNIINRFSSDSSCFLLSPFNPLRTVAIQTLLHPLFSLLILLMVLINCGLMIVRVPVVEDVFIAIYMFEAVVKVVARGFCVGRFTYLRDPWNWLDIMLISTMLVTTFVHLGKFHVLVTIPLMLKIFTSSQGLKKTVEALIQSVKRLADVIILMAFCLSIFALIGLQFFMGNLKHKCVIQFSSDSWTENMSFGYDFDFYSYITQKRNHYYLPISLDPLMCGNSSDAGRCPEGFFCVKAGRNPDYGYTSYDSFFWSLLSVFRLMMQDYWDNLMRLTLRAAGKSFVSVFVLILFPGCFFLLSLIVAAVATMLAEQEEAECADAKQRGEEFSRIVEALKRREEEEEQQASSRAEPPEEQDSPQKNSASEGVEHHGPSSCTCIRLFLKGDCCDCWRRLKQWFHAFIMNPFFDLFIVVCIILNTIFIAMEYYPMTAEFDELLAIANLVFSLIFIAEMIIKLVALGLHGYFKVRWHKFDFILVVNTFLMFLLADVSGLSVLYLVLPARLFRLARWWPTLHLFLKFIWASVGNLTLVLFTMIFMFTMAGLQLFQKDYEDNVCRIAEDCKLPRWHMSNFFHTFLLIFRILCGEWIEGMWDCMEVSNDAVCVIFFMVVLITGNLLILYLFLNLLFSSFINDMLTAPEENGTNNLQSSLKQARNWIWTLLGTKSHTNPDHKGDTKTDSRKDYLTLNLVSSDQLTLDGNQDSMAGCRAPVAVAEIEFMTAENEDHTKTQQHSNGVQKLEDENPKGNTPEDCCCNSCYRCCPLLKTDASQGTGRVWSNFRRACLCIVQHKFFEGFIVFVILLSCVALVFEDIYLEHRPVLQRVLNIADLVFTYVFLLEMLLKLIAFGFKKYFTSFWCWLDFLILDVSLLSLIVKMFGYSSRPLRALRTLRVPSRFKGMRVVLRALAVMFPSMFSTLLVVLFIWLFFSIVGVNLFAGKFFYCYNETSKEIFHPNVVNNISQCFSLIEANFTEVRWKNMKLNFDHTGMGLLSLLVTGTSTGWMDIMYAAVDSRAVADQPVYEANKSMYLYFICFIIFGCFFTLSFFIRVFIDTVHQQRHKFGGKHVFMTEEQQKYLRTMKKRLSEKNQEAVPRPQNCCLAWLFDLVTTLYFEIFMVVVICANMVVLMVETDDQSYEKEHVLYWLHFIFIIIFLIEFILKILVLRQHYFKKSLNIVDFVVLILSIAGVFLADFIHRYFMNPICFSLLRLGRLFALCRTLHLTGHPTRIWKLILGFMMSLPALLNIGLLLFFLIYTFSIIGMFNFADAKKEMMIDDLFNFETFGNSIISMIMVTMTSRWDGLLIPTMNVPPDCDPDIPGSPYPTNCVSPVVGIAFFTSYILLFFLLVCLLFIVVILEIFNTMSTEDTETLGDDHLQMFYETWGKFDPDGSQVILHSELSDFCDALQEPLRIPKPNTIKLAHMDLPLLPGDQISCLNVLQQLNAEVFGESGQLDALKDRLEQIFRINNPAKVSCEPISSSSPLQLAEDGGPGAGGGASQ